MRGVPGNRFKSQPDPELSDGFHPDPPLDLLIPQGTARPSEIVERLCRMRHEPLVLPNAWQPIAEMARELPVPVHTLFLECRLHAGLDRTDFGFGLPPGPELASWTGRLRADAALTTEWRRVATFLNEWASLRAPWSNQVPFIFMAFDHAVDSRPARVAPCLSVCIDPHFHARRDRPDARPPPEAQGVLEVARDSCRELTGAELSAAACESFRALAEGDGVELRHVSFMLSRRAAATKIDLRLPLSGLSSYLERQEWPCASMIVAHMRKLVPFGGHVQLNLPLDVGVGRRLEIEVFAGHVEASRVQRFRFLEQLVERGLASSDKVRVLRAIHEQPLVEFAPGAMLGSNFYVKLCFEDGEPREAKAYVGWMPRRLPNLMRHPSLG